MEKKRRDLKKMKLNRETLRFLESSELRRVEGGVSVIGTCNSCPNEGTATCCLLT
ncbi:MAG TPA: hypothetical protein VGP73_00460 [Thermoanaerobaculia bacterium]